MKSQREIAKERLRLIQHIEKLNEEINAIIHEVHENGKDNQHIIAIGARRRGIKIATDKIATLDWVLA